MFKGLIPNPPPDTMIGKDDTMILLCSEADVERLNDIFIQ